MLSNTRVFSQFSIFNSQFLSVALCLSGEISGLKALMNLPGMWIDRAGQRRTLDKSIPDLDSSVSETYGRQKGSA